MRLEESMLKNQVGPFHGHFGGWPRLKKRALFGLALLIVAAGTTVWAAGSGNRDPFFVGLWGDLPYNDVQALVGVPNMIADMNSQQLAFTVHDGDLKAGHGIPGSVTPTICSDELYQYALDHYFNQLNAPAAFTPGDNDWTDCDASDNGPFNSLERLDHERQVFFSSVFTLGQHKLKQGYSQRQNVLATLAKWLPASRTAAGRIMASPSRPLTSRDLATTFVKIFLTRWSGRRGGTRISSG
jgi:hypothetical protein